MNYIELINRFWKMNTENAFSPIEGMLYFKILEIANRLNWKEPLSLPSKRLYMELNISRNAFVHARQKLHDVGLIKYKSRGRKTAGLYWYNKLEMCQDMYSESTNVGTNLGTNLGTYLGTNTEHIVVPYIRQELDKDKSNNIDTNVSKFSSENIPFEKIVKSFNEVCKSYSPVKQLTDKRKKHIRARYAKHPLEEILTVFRKMEASKFLTGNNNSGWQASFDWVFKNEDNLVKVLEGKYDDKEVKHGTTWKANRKTREKDDVELYKNPAGTEFTDEELDKLVYNPRGNASTLP